MPAVPPITILSNDSQFVKVYEAAEKLVVVMVTLIF